MASPPPCQRSWLKRSTAHIQSVSINTGKVTESWGRGTSWPKSFGSLFERHLTWTGVWEFRENQSTSKFLTFILTYFITFTFPNKSQILNNSQTFKNILRDKQTPPNQVLCLRQIKLVTTRLSRPIYPIHEFWTRDGSVQISL